MQRKSGVNSKKILIVSGEPSGDMHAANLVRDLKSLKDGLEFFGMGGGLSKKAGVEIVFDISRLALVGIVEVLKNLAVVGRAYRAVLERVDASRPALAILVDYPGFNLRLASELKKRGIPVVYYISPQVWAWGRDRVNIIKRCVRKIIVFFKFEEELYRTYGIDVEFVGHPLLDIVKTSLSKAETLKRYGLSGGKTTIALLPGSREMEVKRLLPIMAHAARIVKEGMPSVQFLVAKHPDLSRNLYDGALKDAGVDCAMAEGAAYDALGASDFAIVASGTATLETAIIGTPLVITYKTNALTFMIGRLFTNLSFLGIINIIAGKEIAPEFLQLNAAPAKIGRKVLELLNDEKALRLMREEFGRVKASLGLPGASLRGARAILPLIQ